MPRPTVHRPMAPPTGGCEVAASARRLAWCQPWLTAASSRARAMVLGKSPPWAPPRAHVWTICQLPARRGDRAGVRHDRSAAEPRADLEHGADEGCADPAV